MKAQSAPLEVAGLVVLVGLGVYFAVVVPALTMTLHTLPVGFICLAAALVLVILMVRRSRR